MFSHIFLTSFVYIISIILHGRLLRGPDIIGIMRRVKSCSYNLRKETCFKPKINTMHLKNSFMNHLAF